MTFQTIFFLQRPVRLSLRDRVARLILVGFLLPGLGYNLGAQPFLTDTIWLSGDQEDQYNIVVLAEAFRTVDQAKFSQAAKSVEASLRKSNAYGPLLDHINIFSVFTPSQDSTVSLRIYDPSPNDPIQEEVLQSTFFSIYYRNSYRAYFMEDSIMIKARRIAAESFPFADATLILTHVPRGVPGSGRASAFQSVALVGTDEYGSSQGDYLVNHELGHAIAGLADAYDASPQESFNKTVNKDPTSIRWHHLLNDEAVGIDSVGVGVYVPNIECIMCYGPPEYFCPVCTERINEVITTPRHAKIPQVHRLWLEEEKPSLGEITVMWDPLEGAENYEVIYRDFLHGSVHSRRTQTNRVTFIGIPGVMLSNQGLFSHALDIRADAASYSSHYANLQVAVSRYPSVPLDTPHDVSISEVGATTFRLSWSQSDRGLASMIRLRNEHGGYSEILTGSSSIVLRGLKPNRTYSVEIAATRPFDLALESSSPFTPLHYVTTDISTAIPSEVLEDPVHLYPTPSSGIVFVDATSAPDQAFLVDTWGRTHTVNLGSDAAKSFQLDLSSFAVGVYLLQLHQGSKTITRKIVIQ